MDNDAEYRLLQETLKAWVSLPDDAWPLLKAVFRLQRLAPREFVLKPGDPPGHVLFVASGLVRYFSGGRRQREFTKVFLRENQFSPVLEGCPLEGDHHCGIQALEASAVLVADADAFRALYDQHPAFDRLGRLITEGWLRQKEALALAFQQQDAKDRYQTFVRRNPDLVQRVSQVHISSYLGITEVSLSRIRRTLARTPSSVVR